MLSKRVNFQTIERTQILDGADRLPEGGVHILGPALELFWHSHFWKSIDFKQPAPCFQVKEANVDLDIIEPEVQDFSVFRGNSGVSFFHFDLKSIEIVSTS